MPVETRYSEEFAAMVAQIMGDDTYRQGSIKTSISAAYLLSMKSGKVPTEAFVNKFANGYKLDADQRRELLIAAGYYRPAGVVESVKAILARESISEQGKSDIESYVKEVMAREHRTT